MTDIQIKEALEKLKKDLSLKATQKVLAKLAGISRGSLTNRQWALNELEEIRQLRKNERTKVAEIVTFNKEERLEENLKKSEEERLSMFYRMQSLNEKISLDEKEKNVLIEERNKLLKENRRLTNIINGAKDSKIIDFNGGV